MKSGLNPRTHVTFDLSPPEDPPLSSTQRKSGLRLKRRSTVRMQKTTTSGGSSTVTPFKELLSRLSEKQCKQLASALLPKAGSRATMLRRRRRRNMQTSNKRKREHETDSEDSSWGDSGSYSSGGKKKKNDSEDTYDSESESGSDDSEPEQNYPPTRTRLAPLPFRRDCKPLGPWV